MSFSKIASIVLYVVVGITIPILILFYFGDTLVNTEEYQAKVQKIENPVVQTPAANVALDLQSADSLANPTDSAATANNQNISVPVVAPTEEEVNFTFIEKLVYYKMDVALVWGYILLIISGLTAVIFPIAYTIVHPANLIRSLLILIGIAVLIGGAYLLSSGETLEIIGYTGTDNSNPGVLKLIDTGLIFSYFVLGLTLIAILYAEISNYFK
jgi:hypothetical protein